MNTERTLSCKCCERSFPEGEIVLGIGKAGAGTICHCPHCKYEWVIETQPHHQPMVQDERITLRVEDGTLYYKDQILMHVYEAGDCDRAPWPARSAKDKQLLAAALYDLRESDIRVSPSARIAVLPSGRLFAFDDYVQ